MDSGDRERHFNDDERAPQVLPAGADGRLMRALFGMGTPRGLQKSLEELLLLIQALWALLRLPQRLERELSASGVRGLTAARLGALGPGGRRIRPFSTCC